MIRKTKSLKEAIALGDSLKVKQVLLQDYSFNQIADSLSQYLISKPEKKSVVKVQKLRISKEDFDKYFEVVEKRKYTKSAK